MPLYLNVFSEYHREMSSGAVNEGGYTCAVFSCFGIQTESVHSERQKGKEKKKKRQSVASFALSEDFKFKYSQQSTNTAQCLSSANVHSDLLPTVITAQCN